MSAYLPNHRWSVAAWAIVLASLSGLPAFAQLGQSELITPGGPDEATIQASQGGYASPGPGWHPASHTLGKRFGGYSEPVAQPSMPVQQQQLQPQMQQPLVDQSAEQPEGDGDLSSMNAWQDVPKRKKQSAVAGQGANIGQSELITPQSVNSAGSAFQENTSTAPWSLPSAQSQVGLEPPPGGNMMMPPVIKAPPKPIAQTAAGKPMVKTAAKPVPKQSMNGHVSQSANAPHAATQFDPDAGFPPQTAQMNPMMQMAGGMMGGGMAPVNPQANPMGGGMSAMQQPNPMAGAMGAMGAMGGMGGLGALMGAGGAGAGGGSPMDAIGKAIGAAAQMGLIPSSSRVQGTPNAPTGYDPNTGLHGQQGYMAQPNYGAQPGYGGPPGYAQQPYMGQPNYVPQGGGIAGGGYPQPGRPSFSQMPGVQTGKNVARNTKGVLGRALNRTINQATGSAINGAVNRAIWSAW